ncbi:hypothetical protein ACFWJM_04020 [Streptomyces sp. NPDC127077]
MPSGQRMKRACAVRALPTQVAGLFKIVTMFRAVRPVTWQAEVM